MAVQTNESVADYAIGASEGGAAGGTAPDLEGSVVEAIYLGSLAVGALPVVGETIEGEILERLRIGDTVVLLSGINGTIAETVQLTATQAYTPGAFMRERISVAAVPVARWTSSVKIIQRLRIRDLFVTTVPLDVVETFGIAAITKAMTAIALAERLGLTDALAALARREIFIRQPMRLRAELLQFLSADIVDALTSTDDTTAVLRSIVRLLEGVELTAEPAPQLIARVVTRERVDVSAQQFINMLVTGDLRDVIELQAGYLSGHDFTTWAMNTRTAAVTEYDNYDFNSFARFRNKYVGASSTGLYELVGATDDGEDIVATLQSGYMQFGGTKLSRLKSAYIAMRGPGQALLKISTAEGADYLYQVDTRNMRSTKVHMGKGQRARYFAFELVTSGQVFDLDTLEFVPIVVERRV